MPIAETVSRWKIVASIFAIAAFGKKSWNKVKAENQAGYAGNFFCNKMFDLQIPKKSTTFAPAKQLE